MICPRCGRSTPDQTGRCIACDVALQLGSAAAGAVAIDTTGLPSGASFGRSLLPDAKPAAGSMVGADPVASRYTPTTAATALGLGATVSGGTLGGAPQASGGPLNVGQSFGPRYHIIRLLGLGGMGAVYQAWDEELAVAVALKVIRVDRHEGSTVSPELEKRFKNELLLARQVTHKNVVRIHDLGEMAGIKYITMPYVQGEDLSTLLRRGGKLSVALALTLARQIASGLAAAHDAGVVHRDLKPPNVMISGKGGELQALIMDFGISASTTEAAAGGIIGTLEYMAPEQAAGGIVDARADIYAFGLILYEMLVGLRRATATTPQDRIDAMRQRFHQGVPPIRTLDPSIPESLAVVVSRCLEPDPSARFQSTVELSAALAALDDLGELIPIPPRFGGRLIAGSVTMVLALVGATWWLTWTPPPPKAHAPVSVLIADLQNLTNDPTFDRTLEPMLKRALEGAGFITAYDRTQLRSRLSVQPPERLDEAAAGELAVKQGLGVVLSGSIDRRGTGYGVALKALQSMTGNVVASARGRASNKDEVLEVATKLVAAVRQGLGDDASESAQMFAMSSLSATSLDVVRHYAAAMEAASNNKFEEARQNISKAVALDPKFGIGYQVLAVASRNLGQVQDAEKYINEALLHLDGMTERERFSTRGMFYRVTGDYQQCVKEYSDLIARYAADVVARNQLALCSSKLRDFRRAQEEMRQVVEILPKRVIFRDNLALYSNYAGDFQTGEKEARTIQEPDAYALVALAFAQLGQGQLLEANETYQKLATIGALGASFAASGLGDLAVHEGRFSDAIRILEQGAAADLMSRNPDRAAAKFVALAYAHNLQGRKGPSVAAAEKALAHSKEVKTRFVAARSFVSAGELAKARDLMENLASELQVEPQAYAKIVEGEIALKSMELRSAIKLLTEANGLLDTWIGHFDLGRAYFEAGQFPQADSEFDRCIKRRGEALSLFLDEEPTYGYLPPVYYYQGRVREGLRNAGFADSYRTYLNLRGTAGQDPLLPEVRRRAGD